VGAQWSRGGPEPKDLTDGSRQVSLSNEWEDNVSLTCEDSGLGNNEFYGDFRGRVIRKCNEIPQPNRPAERRHITVTEESTWSFDQIISNLHIAAINLAVLRSSLGHPLLRIPTLTAMSGVVKLFFFGPDVFLRLPQKSKGPLF